MAAASLVPGYDFIPDLLSVSVDLFRGDCISSGLDLLGVVPFAGEVADKAKLARIGDDVVDGIKATDDAYDAAKTVDKVPDVVNIADTVSEQVTSKRNFLLAQATNLKVKNAINELYRPGATTGDGTNKNNKYCTCAENKH